MNFEPLGHAMAEHTPTPWITQKCGELCPDDVMIVADMGIHNGIQNISTVAKALSMRQPADVTAANAAFIVKAVNSHDALVKALEQARDVLGRIADLSTALRSGGPDPMDLQDLSDALSEATDTAYDCHTSACEALALPSHVLVPESDAQSLETREVQS